MCTSAAFCEDNLRLLITLLHTRRAPRTPAHTPAARAPADHCLACCMHAGVDVCGAAHGAERRPARARALRLGVGLDARPARARRAAEPGVRCNLVIALGDLAFRFPNLVEPWTAHLYQPLADPAPSAGARPRRAPPFCILALKRCDPLNIAEHRVKPAPSPVSLAELGELSGV